MKKSIPKIREWEVNEKIYSKIWEREGNEKKTIPTVWQRESQAIISKNTREGE